MEQNHDPQAPHPTPRFYHVDLPGSNAVMTYCIVYSLQRIAGSIAFIKRGL
jgi:hypothetical protein